jgi:hypothetical protein
VDGPGAPRFLVGALPTGMIRRMEPMAAVRPAHLVKSFARSALVSVPAQALLWSAILALAASLYARSVSGGSVWSTVAGWSLVGVYLTIGLVGGALAGFVAAAAGAFTAFEADLRLWLPQLPSSRFEEALPTLPIHELRSRYDQIIERAIPTTVRRIRLPGFVHRYFRARLRYALIEDFLIDCERRGAETVGFVEVRDWLLSRGLTLATAPVHAQLRTWRLIQRGVLVLVAAVPLVLWLV